MCVSTHVYLAMVCVLLSEGAGVDLNVSLSLYEALHVYVMGKNRAPKWKGISLPSLSFFICKMGTVMVPNW